MRDTQRGSQSYMEKRRRREIEVTRRRRGGVKRGESSNQFPTCSPQPGIPREIPGVEKRRGEGAHRGDLGERRECQKEREKSSQ